MSSPIAASSQPRYVEMNRRFDVEKDGGKDMEVSMAASVFKDLQASGHIPKDAKLSDRPPAKAEGLKGTSYEARLVELITDRDKNGKLDLDLDKLSRSGLLSKAATTDELEKSIGGRQTGLSDKFMLDQTEKSGLGRFLGRRAYAVDARGKRVQRYADTMVLSTNQDRASAEYQSKVGERAARGEGAAVAKETVAGAQVLAARGDQRNAQELLRKTGDELLAAGDRPAARKVFEELQKKPYKDVSINLVQDRVDALKAKDPSFDPRKHVIQMDTDHATIELTANHNTTYGELATKRLSQIELHDRMEATLGRKVDPQDTNDARAYFQRFSQGKDTAAVQQELGRYLDGFYAHAGQGVTWKDSIPEDSRPGRTNELMRGLPEDAAGRKIIDCEGFTYLTGDLLGGVKDADGKDRFAVRYATRPGHIIAGVYDRSSQQAFTVNNQDTKMIDGPIRGDRDFFNGIGRELIGQGQEVMSISDRPSASQPMEGRAPKVGALVWNGHEISGAVTAEGREKILAYWRERGLVD
jgi:hypothetical protein